MAEIDISIVEIGSHAINGKGRRGNNLEESLRVHFVLWCTFLQESDY